MSVLLPIAVVTTANTAIVELHLLFVVSSKCDPCWKTRDKATTSEFQNGVSSQLVLTASSSSRGTVYEYREFVCFAEGDEVG